MTRYLFLFFIAAVYQGCTVEVERDLADGRWVDLTHDFSNETLYWPTSELFRLDTVFTGTTDAGFYYEAYSFCTAEHGGTHLDAPIHFAEGRKRVDELELDQLIGPGVVVNVSAYVQEDRNYQIRIKDIKTWEEVFGPIPDGSILLFRTGMSAEWPDAEMYLGTSRRGEEALPELSFPGIHPDTAQWLVENRLLRAVGLDTPSIDYGQSELFESHQIFFEENIPGFENLTNLDELPAVGAFVVALPMKIRGGSGAPLRIVAHVQP